MGTLFSLSKSATTICLHMSEITLFLFGALLVWGLMGESAKSDRWKSRKRMFEIFVIIGVAGELFADGGIFLFSEHLQVIADQEIFVATEEAGAAKDSADAASKDAQRAKQAADDAVSKSGSAVTASSKALTKANQVNSALDSEKNKLDAIEAKRVELERLLLTRSLPRQLKGDLGGLLQKLPPAKAEILFEAGDSGSALFASDIQANLVRGGWPMPDMKPVPAERFNGNEFAIWGVEIFTNKVRKTMFEPSCDFGMASLMAKNFGLSNIEAERFAVLCASTGAGGTDRDSSLPDNFFKVVVGPRDPRQ